MVLKKLFGKSGEVPRPELTIDDLIVLERYEDAAAQLQERVRSNPIDLHSHLKLAEVYVELKRATSALDEFLFVADSYTDDGFYDKAVALLGKAARLAPADESIQVRVLRNNKLKSLEHLREMAFEGLRLADPETSPLTRASLLELHQIWNSLAMTRLIERLRGEQLKRLFAACELINLPPKTQLGERGGANDSLYIIVKGTLEAVLFLPESGGMQVRTFTAGDILGESGLFERRPWPATVGSSEATKLFRLSRGGLERALTGNPDPRALIDALRWQRNDRELETIAAKLYAPPT